MARRGTDLATGGKLNRAAYARLVHGLLAMTVARHDTLPWASTRQPMKYFARFLTLGRVSATDAQHIKRNS